MNKEITIIPTEFVYINWNKSYKEIETIFREFDLFYGLTGKQELDRGIQAGGLERAIYNFKREYNEIPYTKRTFRIY
jgi:hypothetical protein